MAKGDSRRRRLTMLWASGIILVGVAGATVGYAINVWLSPGQQIAVTDVLTLGTLVVAVVAGLIALVAYVVSTGQPDLKFKIKIDRMPANNPLLVVTETYLVCPEDQDTASEATQGKKLVRIVEENTNRKQAVEDKKRRLRRRAKSDGEDELTIAYVWVSNKSKYPAKNPAVYIAFPDKAGFKRDSKLNADDSSPAGRWIAIEGYDKSIDHCGGDYRQIMWEGGMIHGYSTRQLPRLSFVGFYHDRNIDKLRVTLLADGYEHSLDIPIRLKKKAAEVYKEVNDLQAEEAERGEPDPNEWK